MAREHWMRRETSSAVGNHESLGDLFRQLADESTDLLRNEKELAKLEIRETATELATDSAKIAIGIGLAAVGGLALTAFLVLLLGNLFNGAYWAGALVVGVLLLLVGGLLARNGMKQMKQEPLAPEATMDSLRQDRRFLAREVRDFRREITS